jgi:hypothetical protein
MAGGQFHSSYPDVNDNLVAGILNCQYEDDFSRTTGMILEPASNANEFIRHHGLMRIEPEMLSYPKLPSAIFITRDLKRSIRHTKNTDKLDFHHYCLLRTGEVQKHGYSPIKEDSSEIKWSDGMDRSTLRADPLSSQNRVELKFRNNETLDTFTVRFCFGCTVPGQDIAENGISALRERLEVKYSQRTRFSAANCPLLPVCVF